MESSAVLVPEHSAQVVLLGRQNNPYSRSLFLKRSQGRASSSSSLCRIQLVLRSYIKHVFFARKFVYFFLQIALQFGIFEKRKQTLQNIVHVLSFIL